MSESSAAVAAIRNAQKLSRTHGLPELIESLREKNNTWSIREAGPYKDATVRSAAEMVLDEIEKLARKRYHCETELAQHMCRDTTTPAITSSSEGPGVRHLQTLASELCETLKDEVGFVRAHFEIP